MLQKKFLLTSSGYLRIGVVHMHRDLLQPGDHPMGGGFWHIDYTAGRLMLSRRSFDYGEPQWGVVTTLHVPKAYMSMRIVYEGEIPQLNFNVSDNLPIDYYDE
ncbi:MAG: hypothetical protein ACI308_10575 [Muribaculaceae bacterium]